MKNVDTHRAGQTTSTTRRSGHSHWMNAAILDFTEKPHWEMDDGC